MGETSPRQPAERVALGLPALSSVVSRSVDDAPGFDQGGVPAYAAAETVEPGSVKLPRAADDVPRESLAERARRQQPTQPGTEG
jgi:hypothetical protein